MANLPDAFFAANHGLTVYANGATATPDSVLPYIEHARAVLSEIGSINVPGVIIEDKGPIIAFHYRMAESEDRAVAAIGVAISGSASAGLFRVQEGRKVIELRPPLPIDKGTAARDLVRAMSAAAVICMGDDTTDIDMFRAVGELGGGVASTAIAVLSAETDPRLQQAADYSVRGVDGVEWLLEEMLRAIPA
jgi:trehalose-phosphatase